MLGLISLSILPQILGNPAYPNRPPSRARPDNSNKSDDVSCDFSPDENLEAMKFWDQPTMMAYVEDLCEDVVEEAVNDKLRIVALDRKLENLIKRIIVHNGLNFRDQVQREMYWFLDALWRGVSLSYFG